MQLRRRMRGRKAGLSARDVHAWERDIRQRYFAIEARLHRPPDLRNTEGDPLRLHELYFEIDSPAYAFDGLKGLAWPIEEAELLHDAELDARGQVRAIAFPWLHRGNATVGALAHTVVGHIRIEGRERVASVHSHHRAKRIRAEIERRFTPHVRYKATDMPSMRSIQSASQRTPRRQDEDEKTGVHVPPEVQHHVEQMLDAHWRNWVHMSIPALGDRTPLEAVKDADGREMVKALLDEMERSSTWGWGSSSRLILTAPASHWGCNPDRHYQGQRCARCPWGASPMAPDRIPVASVGAQPVLVSRER